MVDLNTLSPAALRAAFANGTAEWGRWGSVADHSLYVEAITQAEWPMRQRRMCGCGCRRRATHRAAANGMTMGAGCELAMRRWQKEAAGG